jgi:hypothetical protein
MIFEDPATPPGVRVRTGRFGKLWLRGQSGDAQLGEVADGKGHVDELCRVLPPSTTVPGDSGGRTLRQTPSTQIAVDSRSPFPVFQMDGW